MKFVVLLSGGKDSVFSVVECERYGHECVCAANLHPYEAVEEIDSHTFQSVCSSVVPGVAECLGVPLVRRALRGTAACQSLVYAGAAAGDEVEDLYDLLADVKKAHPEVAAVASGAILSTYQRTRVEDVCSRLGLRSLSYLWMRPQRALLREMRKVRAIVVKTASLGLEPETDLGLRLDLASTRAKFRRLHDRFGFHECGEGGEYESLVLDCARFKRRLVLDETEVLRLDNAPRDCGAVGVLSVLKWHTEPKDDAAADDEEDDDDDEDEDEIAVDDISLEDDVDDVDDDGALSSPAPVLEARVVWSGAGGLASVSGVACPTSSPPGAVETAAQVTACLRKIRSLLAPWGLDLGAVVFAHLFVADISHFAAANAAYISEFADATSGDASAAARPPSRSCVTAALPPGCAALIDCEFVGPDSQRDVLYVRSLSTWAPVCIGPYCQANIIGGAFVFTSGQIGLDPATMTVAPGGLRAELRLAAKHADAVLRATPCDSCLAHAASAVVYVSGDGAVPWRAVRAHVERAVAADVPVVVVRVPALPMATRAELEVVALTHSAHGRARRAVFSAAAWEARATVVAHSFVAGVVRVFKGDGAAASADALAALLRDACTEMLRGGHLRYEHWARVRIFAKPVLCAALGPALSKLLADPSAHAPAMTFVPVASLEPGVRVAAHILAVDLARQQANLWLLG